MTFKLYLLGLLLCLDIIVTMKVELFSKWKPNFGWEVECSWSLFPNDSLQSVRLFNNIQQFMIYRPERDGQQILHNFHLPESSLQVRCAQTADRGLLGACVLDVELYQPPKEDFNFSCEVSGERPTFVIERKDITVHNFVLPSDASVKIMNTISSGTEDTSGRVQLNCTSSGLPAPDLMWTVGTLKVPLDFSGSQWNMDTKLWDAWSLLSYTPSVERLDAVCTPEINTNGHLVIGKSAVYNKANGLRDVVQSLTVAFLFLLLLR